MVLGGLATAVERSLLKLNCGLVMNYLPQKQVTVEMQMDR